MQERDTATSISGTPGPTPKLSSTQDLSSPSTPGSKSNLSPTSAQSSASNPSSSSKPISKLRAAESPEFSPLAMVVGGLGVLIFYAVMCYSTMFSFPWQSNMGFVHGRVERVSHGGKLVRHVQYSYAVKDQTFTNTQTFQLHGLFLSKGNEVDVRYDPDRPGLAFIQSGFCLPTILYAIASLAGMVFILVGLTTRPDSVNALRRLR